MTSTQSRVPLVAGAIVAATLLAFLPACNDVQELRDPASSGNFGSIAANHSETANRVAAALTTEDLDEQDIEIKIRLHTGGQ